MNPAAFDEDNDVLDAPPGAEHCVDALSVWRGVNGPGVPIVITCWRPTPDELAEIARTGRVWLVVMGHTMPPVQVEGVSPFATALAGELRPHPGAG